jgi:23S rRNA (uracil1939-C5)-methyltransferase
VGRRKTLILENVLIEDIGAEGKALARIDNMVVFVPMLIPGDVVDVRIVKKRKKYLEGQVINFKKYSDQRIAPVCEHFGVCGGCKWQHLPYPRQLDFKVKQVFDALSRIGKVSDINMLPIIASSNTYFYRNKLEYTFSSNKWFTREEINSGAAFDHSNAAGFHVHGMFDKIVDIHKCWLQEEPSNEVRNFVKMYAAENKLSFYDTKNHGGFLRNLTVRTTTTGESMFLFSFGENKEEEINKLMTAVKHKFNTVTSLLYTVNTKLNDTIYDQKIITFSGKDFITEKMENLEFRIGPKSFFQTNTMQALNLYKLTRDFAGLTGSEIVYDLYTGTGTIANFVAKKASKVIGIESVPEAIHDAEINSSINGIENTYFIAGDIKDVLNERFISENGKPDVIITDPPRVGMHPDVINSILFAAPEKIVYVSCNPATQARDVELLSHAYKLEVSQPVDMFPHTHHVENIVLLIKK